MLQSYPVFIAAPDSILKLFAMPSAETTWTFRGLSPDEVTAALDRPGLPDPAAKELLDRRRWQSLGDEIRVLPSNQAVRSLPPDVRAGIYDVLARWEDNEFQHSPYFVPEGDVRRWLAGSLLPEQLIDAIARTAYPVGDVLFLTDEEGNGLHSCVYLADDYVFTKNGANILSPWVIMQLAEVRDRYSRRGPVEVKVYRR